MSLSEVGISVVMGMATGWAAKAGARTAIISIGSLFVVLQVLQHYGFLTVRWDRVQAEVVRNLDANEDGKLDEKDVAIYRSRALEIVRKRTPHAVAYGGGALLGFLLL